MNVLAELEFELIYYDIAVQHISHYIKGTPLIKIMYHIMLTIV